MGIDPLCRLSGFHQGNVPPTGDFPLVQGITKGTVKRVFYKAALPLTIPPKPRNISRLSSWVIL